MPRQHGRSIQLSLFGDDDQASPKTSSTFSDNLSMPVHRWFRYSAGFSAQWVRDLIELQQVKGNLKVLDPFAGSGTVVLEAECCNAQAIGIEAHPFVARIAQAKLAWR